MQSGGTYFNKIERNQMRQLTKNEIDAVSGGAATPPTPPTTPAAAGGVAAQAAADAIIRAAEERRIAAQLYMLHLQERY